MSKLEEMQTSVENLKKQVDDALLFADDIKAAIKSNGVELSDDAPVSEYAGKIEGLFEAGKKAEYDVFWDNYQRNNSGNTRTTYRHAFAYWPDKCFYPKYDLILGDYSEGAFYTCWVSDFKARLKECGVILDTSNVVEFGNMFAAVDFKELPTISTISATHLNCNMFQNADLETIDKLILKNDGTQLFSMYFFASCIYLKNIVIEGVIGQNGFNVSWSKQLTKASITSIINALSSTTSGIIATISLTAVNNAFETSTGLADGSTSEEWLTLAATKSNWTISLIDS